MKVYLFYLISSIYDKEGKHINLNVTEKYPYGKETYISLYAYTDNPSFAEKFRDERNESKLILKKKKMDNEEWQFFTCKNPKLLINYYTLDTQAEMNGIYNVVTIPILAPSIEIDYIKDCGPEDVLISLNDFYGQFHSELIEFIRDPISLSKELVFALNTIGLYTYLYYDEVFILNTASASIDTEYENIYDELSISIDEVGLYIHLFGYLY